MKTSQLLYHVIISLLMLSLNLALAASQWEFDRSIILPVPNSLFLARDSRGNIYATSFNAREVAAPVAAVQIKNPDEPKPKIKIIDEFVAPAQRGYAGVAVDSGDNIYLSVDMGDRYPSYIKKYLPTLQPDRTFGNEGVLASDKVRILGLTAHRHYILAAVSWGRFCVIDSRGNFLGITLSAPFTAYIRDLAYVPETGNVYGTDRDGLFVFSGGSLAKLEDYSLHEVVKPKNIPRAGNAIYYSSLTNELFYTDQTAGGLAIYPLGKGEPGLIPTAFDGKGALQPADAVMSTDGRYLYVSDIKAPQVARYRRVGQMDVRELATPVTPSVPPTAAPKTKGASVLWLSSLDEAMKTAREENKPILAYLFSPLVPRCGEVESTVFSDEFRTRLGNKVVWLKLDVASDPRILTQFGIYKVPAVLLLSAKGEEQRKFIGQFTQEQIESAISGIK